MVLKQAVVLAAGKGTRMLSLTKNTPKPLIRVGGRPFIEYLFKNLEKAGFEKIFLVVEYLKEQVYEHFKNHDFSFEIKIIEQGKALGTGHAVNIVKDYVKGDFAVINGDNIYSADDLKKISFDDNYNYIFAIEHEKPESFGVLVEEDGFLVDIEEKPENPKSNLINAGLYKFTPKIFDALDKIERSPRGEYELTSAIGLLAAEKKVKISILNDYWIDLGRFEDFEKVEKFVRKNF
jgi:bifunctional UDP-N-acetylglucosamine pyrophosphorylase/glucosamine-1-phosphate N-acetyltransferase